MNFSVQFGDIFESGAEVLVNPVNRVGVSGAGLAKEFKLRYPKAFQEYVSSCKNGKIKDGYTLLSPISEVGPNLWVLHFPTKNHWKEPSNLDLIENGLIDLLKDKDIMGTVAFPALGCGLGGLNWDTQVEPLMRNYLEDAPFKSVVYIYPEGRQG